MASLPSSKRPRTLAPETDGTPASSVSGVGDDADVEVTKVLEVDGDGGPTQQMIEEEARMAAEREEAERKLQAQQRKEFTKASREDKVARLDFLLSKSIAYSEFLAGKIKKEGEGATACVDGSVKGPALPQPALVTGGNMRPYQLVGVHWLVGLYENGLNGILGDEMGLGKTVQSIAMLAHLREQNVAGPFLVVGPLSTLHNWHREFKFWAPALESVIYHGSKDERAQLRGQYFRSKGKEGAYPVMITSYEIVIRDIKELRKLGWKFVIIDEGHRLKNMNCRLIRELKSIAGNKDCNRLLLTGTPLQNNLTELWSLLNFLLPDIFDDLESFQAWFDFDFSKENTEHKVMQGELQHSVVTKLHQILRPFLLRRLKSDVEMGIPKKFEYILFAWLSDWQQAMYQDLTNKQLNDSSGQRVSLQNVLMQLRKCCTHPYLFEWPRDDSGQEVVDEILLAASGKMQLLDRILTLLKKEGGHQILIFSQMTRMLDILEDYLAWKGFTFRRIDGTMGNDMRRAAMDDFQSDASIDVFLLSTRAGGLGINLVAADTCIIFDSDWNPHADLQAQDRCHRIGQKKTVMVYRLATAATVEEKVLHAAKQKLKLEQLVVSKGKFKDIGQKTDREDKLRENELKDLLAFDPSKAALGKGNKVITDEELLEVLDRSGSTKTGKGFVAVDKVTSAFDAMAS
uniref:Helicase n=1 Tax=Haptolina ericina TaxID=156174 RepID=A0A7S3B0P5_9EUKA|mmetsp:Transcript_45699/g.102996  ORF Transcript_45699/g.102996 Transcript_45699/m.102996 type:complete len:685 (+) Transcript_45699:38-2092(+)